MAYQANSLRFRRSAQKWAAAQHIRTLIPLRRRSLGLREKELEAPSRPLKMVLRAITNVKRKSCFCCSDSYNQNKPRHVETQRVEPTKVLNEPGKSTGLEAEGTMKTKFNPMSAVDQSSKTLQRNDDGPESTSDSENRIESPGSTDTSSSSSNQEEVEGFDEEANHPNAMIPAAYDTDYAICSVCHEQLNYRTKQDKKQFQKHMETHYGLRPYECPVCLEYFQSPIVLMTHSSKHSNEDNFECAECGSMFRTKTKMLQHSRACRSSTLKHNQLNWEVKLI